MNLLAKASVLLLLMFPLSCGPLVEVQGTGGTTPPVVEPPPPPSTGAIGFTEAVGILNNYCSECHANSPWMDTELSLKRSSVKVRVSNKTMPPGLSETKLPEKDRILLLTYPF